MTIELHTAEKVLGTESRFIDLVRSSLDPHMTSRHLVGWLEPEYEFDMAPLSIVPERPIVGLQTPMVIKHSPGIDSLTQSDLDTTIARAGCCLIPHRDMETINQVAIKHGRVKENDMIAFLERMPTLSMVLGTTIPVVLETPLGKKRLPIAIHYEDMGFFGYATAAIEGKTTNHFGEGSGDGTLTWDNLGDRKRKFPAVWEKLHLEIEKVTQMTQNYSKLLYGEPHNVYPILWSQFPELRDLTINWIRYLNGVFNLDVNEDYFRAIVVGTYVGGDPFIQAINTYLARQGHSGSRIERQIIVKPSDHCETPPNMATEDVDSNTADFVRGFRNYCRVNPLGAPGVLGSVDIIAYLPPLIGPQGSALALEAEERALRIDNKSEWLARLRDSLDSPFPLMENPTVLAALALSAVPEIRVQVEKILTIESIRLDVAKPTTDELTAREDLRKLEDDKAKIAKELIKPLESGGVAARLEELGEELAELIKRTDEEAITKSKGIVAERKKLSRQRKEMREEREKPLKMVDVQIKAERERITGLEQGRKHDVKSFQRAFGEDVVTIGSQLVNDLGEVVTEIGF